MRQKRHKPPAPYELPVFSFLLISVLILISEAASAQSLMTLEEAVREGLANNYGIQIARNYSAIASNNATPGNAGMLPEIGIRAAYAHGVSNANVKVVSGGELNETSAASDLATAGINLSWTLFDGMKMFITYDKLKKLEAMGELGSVIAVENTVARIMAAWYNIIRQERESELMREQVELSKTRLALAQLRYETGSGSETDYLKARVELNADISALSGQETARINARATLNELLARDVTTPFLVSDTIRLLPSMAYDSLRARMKRFNRNILLAEAGREVSRLEVKSAGASRWPTLDLTAGYNFLLSETQASFISYNRNFGPSIGITASMDIFRGHELQREYRNARLSSETTELELRQLENRLDAYLLKIWNTYLNQTEMIGFEKESLELARKNMEIARESYRVGSISALQLREIQKDLLDAGLRLVTAVFQAKLAETELRLLSGGLVGL